MKTFIFWLSRTSLMVVGIPTFCWTFDRCAMAGWSLAGCFFGALQIALLASYGALTPFIFAIALWASFKHRAAA